MRFSFEVKDCDLQGRIGLISLGGRRLETPCLLPVVHPVSQAVPPSELKSMGFGGLMTNSYILSARRKDEALREGVHRVIGYDGVVMTDSGGYQVLEYGDLGVGFRDVAAFQAGIRSDLAVTLDRPTGYPQSRRVAKETVDYSMDNAVATLKEFGGAETTWVGPVQGGLHLDLVKRSARGLAEAGFQMLALGSPVQVMQNYMFADLARMILGAKRAAPYSVPMHLFGAGHPLTMALAVALGCDTFDSASYILYARRGRYMLPSGAADLEKMRYLPCSCPSCVKSSVKELLELEHADRTKALAVHNLHALRAEVEACKEAIAEGRLWDLVLERSQAHPRLKEAIGVLSENQEFLSQGTPALKDRGLFIRSPEDAKRPELEVARRRLARAARRSAPKAVLEAEKAGPVVRARGAPSGKQGGYDLYRMHPVLGAYPAELEFVYPFAQTVASEGAAGEWKAKEGLAALRKMGYRSVEAAGARRRVRSRRRRKGGAPSPPSPSARSRSPRRP